MLKRARRPVNKQPQFRARAQFYLPPFAMTVLAALGRPQGIVTHSRMEARG